MAIDLPDVPFQASFPRLVDSVSVSRTGNRMVSVVEYADPFWQIDMVTVPLSPARRLLVEAFRDQARGGLVTIRYTPKHSCLPKAYWGNPDAAAVNNAGSLSSKSGYDVVVGSVTDGLVLAPGDLIGMSTGVYNSLFRVVTGATAAGGQISLKLNVPVPSYIGTGATVVFKSPVMNARMMPGSFQMRDTGRPSAQFSLVEVSQ